MPDDRRRLRQQLESLSLAGLRFLPRREIPPQMRLPVAAAAPVSVRAPDPNPIVQSAKASMVQPKTVVSKKAQALAVLNDRVKGCTRCKELTETRTQTVFGVGDPEARILFIGEAPGADEDAQGEPFVGRAGQLLNQIITASRLKREEIYICNVLKCRPPDNRTPAEDECANCREYLDGQLAAIDPDYIVCWGAVAAQNLLRSTLSIGKMRGKFLQHGRAKVLCTYHPSYLLRNPAAKKDVWQDMQFLMADMGIDLKSQA